LFALRGGEFRAVGVLWDLLGEQRVEKAIAGLTLVWYDMNQTGPVECLGAFIYTLFPTRTEQ